MISLNKILAVEGYAQVTKFLQGYVDNELNFNQEDTCQYNCEDFKLTQNVRCADKTLCAQNFTRSGSFGWPKRREVAVCHGQVRDCKQISSDDIEVCYSDNSIRRYHYLKYVDGTVHGSKPSTECTSINYVICCHLNANIPKNKDTISNEVNFYRQNHGVVGLSNAAAAIVCAMIQRTLNGILVYTKSYRISNKISKVLCVSIDSIAEIVL